MTGSTFENVLENSVAPAITDEVIRKAYHFVALSSSIAIQDAVDNLRSVNTICTTIISTAMAQALENYESKERMQEIIVMAQNISENAAANCQKVSQNAAVLVRDFPMGQ
jgi:hypothetical protein